MDPVENRVETRDFVQNVFLKDYVTSKENIE